MLRLSNQFILTKEKEMQKAVIELNNKQNINTLTPQSVRAKVCKAPQDTEMTLTWSLKRVCTGCGAWYSNPISSIPSL